MKVGSEAVMASIRAAVAEQRAAALALDPSRLSAASQRLTEALSNARRKGVGEVPPESHEVAAIQRELRVSAEVVQRGQAAASGATQALGDSNALYVQSGAPAPAAPTPAKPIAAA